MAFQTLNINGRIHMNPRVMNENGREGWTKKTYQEKNKEKGNHYNSSRSSLNFELTKDGHFAFLNDSRHVPIEQRLNERLKKIGFNYYKEDSKNAPYSCVDIIVGGDHDRMNEIGSNFFRYLVGPKIIINSFVRNSERIILFLSVFTSMRRHLMLMYWPFPRPSRSRGGE